MHLCRHITGAAARTGLDPRAGHHADRREGDQQAGDSSAFHLHSGGAGGGNHTSELQVGFEPSSSITIHTKSDNLGEVSERSCVDNFIHSQPLRENLLFTQRLGVGLMWSFVIKWGIYCCENPFTASHFLMKSSNP